MNAILHLLVGLTIVGDYLMLSLSHVALGTKANWLALVAAVQLAALALAVAIGRGRGLRFDLPMLGCAGIGLVMLAHAANRAIDSSQFDDYGTLKTLTWFGVTVPALLLGCVVGRMRRLPGVCGWLPLVAPLLLVTGIAALTEPDLMTVREAEDMAVFLGVIVLPVHQALAFSLGKIALWFHATTSRREPGRARRVATVAAIGFCLGMAVLSGARGYLLAAIAALAVQWLGGRRRLGVVALIAAIPLVTFAALSSEAVQTGLDLDAVLVSNSWRERLDLYSAAVDAFWASPLFGQGPGGFATFSGWEERIYPHNILLEILSECGLAGGVCFGLVLVPVLIRIAHTLRRCVAEGRRLDEVQCLAIGLFVFATIGAMGVADLIRNYYLFFAAGMAAVACGDRTSTIPRPTQRRVDTPAKRVPAQPDLPAATRPRITATVAPRHAAARRPTSAAPASMTRP